MKQIIFALIGLLTFSFFSCEKEGITPQEEQESLFPLVSRSSKAYDAQITIQARMFHSIDLIPHVIQIRSFFMDENRQPVEIGGISIENIALEQSERTPQYDITVGFWEGDTTEAFVSAFQNNEATIQIDGGQSSFPDLDTLVPLPSLIVFEEPIDSINKSKPLTLSWKNAGDNSTEPVGILITYNPYYYSNANSEIELPEEAASLAKIIDSGNKNSVTISREELSKFPANGHVKVQIGRGVQTFVEEGDKTFLINGLSFSGWTDVVIYENE